MESLIKKTGGLLTGSEFSPLSAWWGHGGMQADVTVGTSWLAGIRKLTDILREA